MAFVRWKEQEIELDTRGGRAIRSGFCDGNFAICYQKVNSGNLALLIHAPSCLAVGAFLTFGAACVAAAILEDLADWSGAAFPVPDAYITNAWLYGGLLIGPWEASVGGYVWEAGVALIVEPRAASAA